MQTHAATARPLDSEELIVTDHAARRLRERGLADWQLEFAVHWGTRLHRNGATFFHVRHRDLPAWLDERCARRLLGVTVVVAEDAIITAYAKRDGFHDLKRTPRRAGRRGGLRKESVA